MSCAALLLYGGETFVGNATSIGPVEGAPLGQATDPGCGGEPPARRVAVVAVVGVSPALAIMRPGKREVFIREHAEGRALPPSLLRLLRPVRCQRRYGHTTVSGRWIGILGADGRTELDLRPPYDVRVFVDRASARAYDRAELTIRVPGRLGRPITRSDIRRSLWAGGRLSVTFACRGNRFVATRVDASPP